MTYGFRRPQHSHRGVLVALASLDYPPRRIRGARKPGSGAVLGIGSIAFPLATVLLPIFLLGATGVLLATLVLSSLPQLPGEKAMSLRRNAFIAKTHPRR